MPDCRWNEWEERAHVVPVLVPWYWLGRPDVLSSTKRQSAWVCPDQHKTSAKRELQSFKLDRHLQHPYLSLQVFQRSFPPLGLCAVPVPSPGSQRHTVYLSPSLPRLNWNLSRDTSVFVFFCPLTLISRLAMALFNISVISMEIPAHSRKSKPCSVIRTVAPRRGVSSSGVEAPCDKADLGLKGFPSSLAALNSPGSSVLEQQSSPIN